MFHVVPPLGPLGVPRERSIGRTWQAEGFCTYLISFFCVKRHGGHARVRSAGGYLSSFVALICYELIFAKAGFELAWPGPQPLYCVILCRQFDQAT